MASITFDTLKFVGSLEHAGIKRDHATAVASAVRDAQDTALADHAREQQEFTAKAIAELDGKTGKDIFKTEMAITEMRAEMMQRFTEISAKFDLLEQRTHSRFTLLQWMLGVLIAGVLALVMRAFFFPALPPVM